MNGPIILNDARELLAQEVSGYSGQKAKVPPEVFAAFDAGDKHGLRRALKLPPWHASLGPRWTGSIWSRDMLGIVAARRSGDSAGDTRGAETH